MPAHARVAAEQVERDQHRPDPEHARDVHRRPVRVHLGAEATRELARRDETRAAVEEAYAGEGDPGVVAAAHMRILLDRTTPW